VVLCLQADLDDFHWSDDCHSFCDTGGETSCTNSISSISISNSLFSICAMEIVGSSVQVKHTQKCCLSANNAILVCQQLLVCLKRGESDGHLGHDAGDDGAEAFVETERSLALHDFCTGGDEAAGLDLYPNVRKPHMGVRFARN
jgi:hypothetical protein